MQRSESDNSKRQSTRPLRAHFPDESFIRPGRPLDSAAMPPPESAVRDTYFSKLFREWMRDGKFDFDSEIHDNFREVITAYIRQYVAVKMVTDDVTYSVPATGVALDLDVKRINALASSILDVKLIGSIVDVLGFGDHKDEIITRELDKLFGVAPIQAAEKRLLQQQHKDNEDWTRNTVSNIHNMLREMSGAMKTVAGNSRLPAPANPSRASDAALKSINSALASMSLRQVPEETSDGNTGTD